MTNRLLAGLEAREPLSLERHLDTHGGLPKLDRERLLAELTASGLRGRGGAGFPSAIKAEALGRRRPVLVVNASEGEPMSVKDRVLLTRTPHLVLDGAMVAAAALGAREAIIAAPADVLPLLAPALHERERLGGAPAAVQLHPSGSGYVSGEESALIAHLEGRPAKPRVKPPLPVHRGVGGRPTLVHNAETLAHLALIARHGAAWFRERGTDQHPGTTLVTISGAVEAPGVYEVDLGTPLAGLVATAGGAVEALRAFLVGGYFGAWVDSEQGSTGFDHDSLRPLGASVGAGVLVAFPAGACGVAETARLARWMAGESAGQCGPCVHGLPALADLLERYATGRALQGDRERLARWTALVRGRGACHHPDGTARMIASATHVFARELADHARRGPCRQCTTHVLALPRRQEARAA
jgi:NADH:ubiquinone oxidoreductase subunit F (NADH-binding)